MKEKRKMFKEKIEGLIEIIAKKKRWDCYEILNLDVILDDGKFVEANITVKIKERMKRNERKNV